MLRKFTRAIRAISGLQSSGARLAIESDRFGTTIKFRKPNPKRKQKGASVRHPIFILSIVIASALAVAQTYQLERAQMRSNNKIDSMQAQRDIRLMARDWGRADRSTSESISDASSRADQRELNSAREVSSNRVTNDGDFRGDNQSDAGILINA